jgi:hypothetical protein
MNQETRPIRRALAALTGLAMAANGVVMLAAGRWWYGAVPGVTGTGPYNPHFVRDIGAAYLTAGLALGWLGLAPSREARGAAAAGAAFLILHAAIHLAEAATDPMGLAHLARDFAGVILPALVAAALAWLSLPQPETRHA